MKSSSLNLGSAFIAFAMAGIFASAATAEEPLAWKFSPGLTNHYQMTQDMKLSKTGAGGEFTVTSNMTMDMSWVVEKVNEDGSASLKQKIDRMRMKIEPAGGQASEIDSAAKGDPQGQAAMLAPFMKAMTSNPFTVTMTPRGEVKDVQVPQAIVDALKNQPGAAQMGDLASPEGFKKLVSQASFVLPEKLEPGATWTQKTETNLTAIGTQTAQTTYKYEGADEKDGKKLEKFSAKVSLKFTGGQVPIEIPKQESSGEILFNREAGRLESSHIKQTTELKITVGTQVVNQTINQTIGMTWKENSDKTEK
jgi:hypothetical protein